MGSDVSKLPQPDRLHWWVLNRVFHAEPSSIVPMRDIEEMWAKLCDGGTTMDRDCLRRALKILHLRAFSDRKLTRLYRVFDTDGQGYIDFDQFLVFITHHGRDPNVSSLAVRPDQLNCADTLC